jgi:hypothetical protein
MIEIYKCKRMLAVLWAVGILGLYLIILIQTLFGKHEDHINDVWGWLLQCTIPLFSLIIGAFSFSTFNPESDTARIDKFSFRLSYFLSVFYLIVILAIIISQPLSGKPLWELGSNSNIYIAPLQGIVSGAVGLFFSKGNA